MNTNPYVTPKLVDTTGWTAGIPIQSYLSRMLRPDHGLAFDVLAILSGALAALPLIALVGR